MARKKSAKKKAAKKTLRKKALKKLRGGFFDITYAEGAPQRPTTKTTSGG